MKRALILTVGTRTRPDTNIVRPLVKTIRHSHPDFVAFVASSVSKKYAEDIARELGMDEKRHLIYQLNSPEDIQSVFQEMNALIREIQQKGFDCEDMEIDFTSGTKAMTGGAVISAIFHACGSLKYITGDRKNGVVMDGTEKFLSITPEGIFALQELQMSRRFILELRFEAALKIAESINSFLLDSYQRLLLDGLTNLALAYQCWEAFDHKKFCGYYSKVNFSQPEVQPFKIGEGIPQRLVSISRILEKERINEDALADIFNNARRRFDEGKYDDALSRLYRMTEMFAQWELSSPPIEIQTSDVDLNKIPASRRNYYEGLRDREGKIRLGLQKSYELLAQLGVSTGDQFLQDNKFKALLYKRNFSILAHGMKPISREECRSLFECVESLICARIGNFQALVRELDFPWRVKRA
ncbi:MAG: TIGR02710 family CRISPR-associated protein [Deltaproteobacteria bacterium]|nr:TIGR02710 family CRISPR-associated protein [Deltaproteobacteria bacterium]